MERNNGKLVRRRYKDDLCILIVIIMKSINICLLNIAIIVIIGLHEICLAPFSFPTTTTMSYNPYGGSRGRPYEYTTEKEHYFCDRLGHWIFGSIQVHMMIHSVQSAIIVAAGFEIQHRFAWS